MIFLKEQILCFVFLQASVSSKRSSASDHHEVTAAALAKCLAAVTQLFTVTLSLDCYLDKSHIWHARQRSLEKIDQLLCSYSKHQWAEPLFYCTCPCFMWASRSFTRVFFPLPQAQKFQSQKSFRLMTCWGVSTERRTTVIMGPWPPLSVKKWWRGQFSKSPSRWTMSWYVFGTMTRASLLLQS